MNVFNISNTKGPGGPEDRGGVRRAGSEGQGGGTRRVARADDSFSTSGKAAQADALVEALRSGGTTRADLVDKFKALMSTGALDTPQAAQSAADAILGIAGGQ